MEKFDPAKHDVYDPADYDGFTTAEMQTKISAIIANREKMNKKNEIESLFTHNTNATAPTSARDNIPTSSIYEPWSPIVPTQPVAIPTTPIPSGTITTTSTLPKLDAPKDEPKKDGNPKTSVGSRKFSLSVMSSAVTAEIAVGMLEGARKYGRHNWRDEGAMASVYWDAACRHLIKWWEGEDIDPDSGLPHVVKAIGPEEMTPVPRATGVIDPALSPTLVGLLDHVVNEVDFYRDRTLVPGYAVGGKTGTAQIWDPKARGGKGDWKRNLFNYTFVGYIGRGRPELIVAVRIQEARPTVVKVGQLQMPVMSFELFRRIATDAIITLDLPAPPSGAPLTAADGTAVEDGAVGPDDPPVTDR